MTSTTPLPIACHCALNTFTFLIPTSSLPLLSRICHCSSCRHATGSLLPISVHLPSSVTRTSFPLGTTLRAALDADGKETTRWFCVRCGAHVLMAIAPPEGGAEGDETWTAMAGVVKGWEDFVEVRSHIFVGDTVDGGGAVLVPEIDGREIPMWTEGEGSTPFVVPPSPTSDLTNPPTPATDETEGPLLVQCLCTKTTLRLARPSLTQTHLDSSPVITPHSADEQPWHTQNLSHHPTRLYHTALCVCHTCTSTSGSPFFPWTYIPLSRLSVAPPESNSPTTIKTIPLTPTSLRILPSLERYASSPGVERHFCRSCGASVFYTHDSRPELVDVAVGLLRCGGRAKEGARMEGWLEWRKGVGMLAGREDEEGGVGRAVRRGMREWGTAGGEEEGEE